MTSTPTIGGAVQGSGPDGSELDQSSQDISAAIIAMMRQLNGIKSRIATSPNGEHSPLFLLFQLAHQGPRRASDLAEQLCADPSTVSRQVAWLVKEQLIERRADPDDGRASILVPTDKGLATVKEHTARRGATMQPVIADWPEQDRADFLRLITKYTEGIEAHREQIIQAMLRHHGKES
jgi:DNA-binding MarR family transcriptional regulator